MTVDLDCIRSRRMALKMGAGAVVSLVASGAARALAASCGLTPPQAEGPFYPGEANFTLENDLTRVPGHLERAAGQVIYVRGRVVDSRCAPLQGATVEIWQACASGRYNNPSDPNPSPLDPHFRYWGETVTNVAGEYVFKTVVPGAYPADERWFRPPHIHFKISKIGYHDLITQMYFKDEPLNESDLILEKIPAAERERVIVKFASAPAGFEPGALLGDFEITLRAVR